MTTHEETRKERLQVSYNLFGICADVSQLARAYLRNENKGVKKNIIQIISKLDKLHKRL